VVPVVPLSSTDDSAKRVLIGAVVDITSKDSKFQSAEGILVDLDSQFSRETQERRLLLVELSTIIV
jgi:hypothetical protein